MINFETITNRNEMVKYFEQQENASCSDVKNACETLFFLNGVEISEDEVMIALCIGE